MSRSVRYALGVSLVLVLLGAGSGFAVAKWGQRDAGADWGAVARGGECVAGELREVVDDVAGMLSPDRAGDTGQGDAGVRADSGGEDAGGTTPTSALTNLLAQGRDLLNSLSEGVPRLDEGSSGSDNGC